MFLSSLFLDDGIDRPKPREGKPQPQSKENLCLIRMKAQNDKVCTVLLFSIFNSNFSLFLQISTVVKNEDVPRIIESYGKIMKATMDGLKKVKRVKNKTKNKE